MSYATLEKDSLRVAVYNSPPFGMQDSSGRISGLMVELWEDIAADLNLEYTYTISNMDSLLSGVQNGTFDIGLGAISITPKREKIVDFTHAVNPSGTGIATSLKANKTSFLKKWTPVFIELLELIGILATMLFVSASIVLFIEKKYHTGEPSKTNIKNIADGLWWSAVTMTTVGYGDKIPTSRAGKLLGVIWIFVSIIFFSLFTASAGAKLANYESSSSVNSLNDLKKIKIVTVKKSSGEEFLEREKIAHFSKNNIEEAIQAVLSNEADAIVSNIPVLKYHNNNTFIDELLISDAALLRNNMGIVLSENNPLKEELNLLLLKKISEPKWQQALYKYFGE